MKPTIALVDPQSMDTLPKSGKVYASGEDNSINFQGSFCDQFDVERIRELRAMGNNMWVFLAWSHTVQEVKQ